MQGARVPDGDMRGSSCFRPGAYGRVLSDGQWIWYACTPNGHLGDLAEHDVTEHDDGTITVSPSILVSDDSGELWHGFLERGVWRHC